MTAFYVYQLPEDHEAIRAAVREVCEARVAPHAAEADETGEFPKASYDALRSSDFLAPHIPAEYGGAGADSIATAIVIEEVARACAASSLIPAVNKLGTMPLLLSASEELKREVLPAVASGEAMFSYALSERAAGANGSSAFVVHKDDPGRRDRAVLEVDLAGRRALDAELALLGADREPRIVLVHHERGDPVRALRRVGRGHHRVVRRDAGVGAPGLRPIQHVRVAVADRAGAHRRGVRAGLPLAQRVREHGLATGDRGQHLPLELLGRR